MPLDGGKLLGHTMLAKKKKSIFKPIVSEQCGISGSHSFLDMLEVERFLIIYSLINELSIEMTCNAYCQLSSSVGFRVGCLAS